MPQSKTASELLNTQNNAEESTQETYSTPLANNEQYKETPIRLRGNNDNGFFATLGDYRITPNFVEITNLEKALKKTDLPLIISLFVAMIETRLKAFKTEINATEAGTVAINSERGTN